jgi:GNAT superfamily N-acetyltransferase
MGLLRSVPENRWRAGSAGVLAERMDVERFDPATDAGAVRACHDIYLAAVRTDNPRWPAMSLPVFQSWMTYGWTEDPSQAWLARDRTGKAYGWYVLSLPGRENRHVAQLSPTVHPSRRRAGLGTMLVAHAACAAGAAGRTLLASESDEASAGEGFARALGAREQLPEIRRVLRVGSIPAGWLAALRSRAESAASGYSLLSWDGPVPEDRLGEIAALYGAEADAPRDAGREAQRWDVTRVRISDERTAAQGVRHYTVAARPEPGGELVAFTELLVDPLDPGWGMQGLTAVLAPHRGHRLGLRIKVAMLELLAEREPQIVQIVTGNADGNEHMIAINAELGFEVLDRLLSWELETARAPALASPDVHAAQS